MPSLPRQQRSWPMYCTLGTGLARSSRSKDVRVRLSSGLSIWERTTVGRATGDGAASGLAAPRPGEGRAAMAVTDRGLQRKWEIEIMRDVGRAMELGARSNPGKVSADRT